MMGSLKETVSTPALAAEAFSKMLRERFPNVKVRIAPRLYADEDISVDIFAPKEILREVDWFATELSMRIEDETGFFVLHFVRPLEEAE